MKKQHTALRRITVIAIAAALLAALCGMAVATNFLGLRDLLLKQPHEGDHTQPLSLSGYMNTPESQALAEWHAFLETYDPDREILHAVGNAEDESLANYSCYLVYAPEMAEKLEEITEKYNLKLHRVLYDVYLHPELSELLGNFLGEASGSISYMYEDGTFHVDDGWAEIDGFGAMEFQLQCSVRGTFHDALLYLDVTEYEEWDYTTAKGCTVKLALGPNRGLILADLTDCFVTVNLWSNEEHGPFGSSSGFTRGHLETLADQLDLALLSPVRTPQPLLDPPTNPPAVKRTDAAKTYAAVLRNLLHSNLLPNGAYAELGAGADTRFSVFDVDGDGREELILLYVPGITAATCGYVIDFDDSYTGNDLPVYIEMANFPDFTFYSGGYMTAGWSHNQGLAGDLLWPYDLYRYDNDIYTEIASVDAWDADAFPCDGSGVPFPAEQYGDNALYYVTFTYAADRYGMGEAGEHILSTEAYNDWITSLGMGEAIEITYLPLTDENIALLDP